MILTDHARRRLAQRFPGLEGDDLLAEWEGAQGRRPTARQCLLIRTHSRRCSRDEGKELIVSLRGIVFVVGEDDVVVTVFPMPLERPALSDGERARRRIRGRHLPRGEGRRTGERHWLRGPDEE